MRRPTRTRSAPQTGAMVPRSLTPVRYQAMLMAIQSCHRLDEVKALHDRARALEVYAKIAMNVEAERQVIEIRLRAERRAGQLLREMKETGQRRKGHGDQKSKSRHATPNLADLGITKNQSSRWQQPADVPSAEFEAVLNDTATLPSTNHFLAKPAPMTSPDPQALWLWGRLCDFERMAFTQADVTQIAQGFLPTMQVDGLRILPQMRQWLERLEIALGDLYLVARSPVTAPGPPLGSDRG